MARIKRICFSAAFHKKRKIFAEGLDIHIKNSYFGLRIFVFDEVGHPQGISTTDLRTKGVIQVKIPAADTLDKGHRGGKGMIGGPENHTGFLELSFQIQTGHYIRKYSISILGFVFSPEGGKTGCQKKGLGPPLATPSRAAIGIEKFRGLQGQVNHFGL